MRVLAAIVVPPHLSVSGGARAGEELSRALVPFCDIEVASMIAAPPSRSGRSDAEAGRVTVRTGLPFGLSHSSVPQRYRTPFYRSDIPRTVREGGYDLVHLHNPMPALEMARIARACRSAGIPYVVSTHGFNEIVNGLTIYGFGAARRAAWKRLALDPVREVVAGAAGIFALSPGDLPLLHALGHEGENVTIVSNGVVPPAAGDAEEDRRLLDRLGIAPREPDSPPTFMFLANHTPNKGLPVLFEAFARVRAPFQLILGGERRQGVAYDRFARATRPGQRIVVTGSLSDEEVAASFRRSDAFVFPTLADTFPLVVLEAMAHGLPVIASAVGGIPHQLRDGCGILVEPGDAGQLTEAIERFVAEPSHARRLAAAARERALSAFTWEGAAERALEGYRRALSGRAIVRPISRRSPAHDAIASSP